MNKKYILSIIPSISNTGFCLWKKVKILSECEDICNVDNNCICECDCCN